MENFYEIKDEKKEYLIVFKEIKYKDKVYMILRACKEGYREEVLKEMTDLAMQSEAKQIFLSDKSCEAEKGKNESVLFVSSYIFQYSHSLNKMVLNLRDKQERKEIDNVYFLRKEPLHLGNRSIFLKIYNESFFHISNSGTYEKSDIDELLQKKEYHAYIFYEKELPVGICELKHLDNEDVIEYIGVNPEFKGKGYGKKIMNDILRHFKNLQSSEVSLLVSEDNLVANNLYQSLGFKDVNTVARWFKLKQGE